MMELIDEICDVLDISGSVKDGVKAKITGTIQNGIEYKKWEKIFIEAGRYIASYENNGLQQNDIRNILFSTENMKELAKNMYDSDPYHFERNLESNLESVLACSSMDAYNQETCLKHFMEIVINDLKRSFPEIINRSLLAESRDNIIGLRGDLKSQSDMICQILENTQDLRREKDYQRSSCRRIAFFEDSVSSDDGIDWHLMSLDINIFDESVENQKMAAIEAIGHWKNEREQYPGWYIAPYEVHRRIQYKTMQYSRWIRIDFLQLDDQLDLCYEFVWRCETGMLAYDRYLQKGIYEIWRAYLNKLKNEGEGIIEREGSGLETGFILDWFFSGNIVRKEENQNGKIFCRN